MQNLSHVDTQNTAISLELNSSSVVPDFDQYARELGLMSTMAWPPESGHPGSHSDGLDLHQLPPSEALGQMVGFATPEMTGVNVDTRLQGSSLLPQQNVEPSLPLPGLVLRKGNSETKYLGCSSVGTTISTCLRTAADANSATLKTKSIDYLVQGIRHLDELSMPPSPFISERPLPDPQLTERCMSAYLNNVHICYPIVEIGDLEGWRKAYESLIHQHDPIKYSRLCLLTAIGYLSQRSQQNTTEQESIQAMHEHVWSLISSALAVPYADSVEILLLHTVYLLFCGKSGIAWVTCGMAIRIAQSLGLHRYTSPRLELGEAQLRRRTMLWEVAYALDAFLSLLEGRPPATTDHPSHAVLLGQGLKDPNHFLVDDPAADVHWWHVQLAFIANRFSTILNGGGLGPCVLEEISILDRELLQWRDSIAMEFRPEQENLAQGNLYPAVTWLHLQYFNLMRTMHWISFMIRREGPQSTHPTQYGPRIRSSETICVMAARSVIKTLSNAAIKGEENVPLLGIPMSYCMAAVSVLFRKVLAEPDTILARTNLEFLRAGSTHILQTLAPGGPMDHFRALFTELQRVAEGSMEGVGSASTS
ncbi:hypothetical protein BJY04DRAFT_214833 [Aspergillus karnatakaensis]|uniref:fungal specific transcription factor domain-containing protein n=1 Tax=Aspergillus karnatakaensis TaxID=1810916 RepID=UPI003CCD4520